MIIGRSYKGKYYRLQDDGTYRNDAGEIMGDSETQHSSRSAICEKNPWVSTAAAVHADQVPRFNEELKNQKVAGAYYREDGKLVCTSRAARNKVLQMRGMRDGDAGYGDYAGT